MPLNCSSASCQKGLGLKSQEASHCLSQAGFRRTIADYNQLCFSRDLLKYVFALLSSTEKCQYVTATHSSYSREILVMLSAENHTPIYLLASLTIASRIHLLLKRKPD